MKDFILPLIPVSGILAVGVEDMSFWERLAERWGIGFVGIALFVALALWTAKREEKAQAVRDKRDEANHLERVDLAKQLLEQSRLHAARLEEIIEKYQQTQVLVATELKAVARFGRCPKVPEQ